MLATTSDRLRVLILIVTKIYINLLIVTMILELTPLVTKF